MTGYGGDRKGFWGWISKGKSKGKIAEEGRLRISEIEPVEDIKITTPGHRVITGFVLAFIFTMVILGGLIWYTLRSNQHLKELETRHFRLLQLSGEIIYLDEVLTMSARTGAYSGEVRWEERYRNYEPKLDAAIKEVGELAGREFISDSILKTDEANVKLVAMENEAFELVRKGEMEAAVKVLHSAEYEKQKGIYSNGIVAIAGAIGDEEKERIENERHIALITIAMLVVLMPLVGFIWVAALRILGKYIYERKRTELTLRTSEQCFSAIADYSYFWEIWVNPKGRPVWTNPAVERVSGYSVHDLMAMRDYPRPLIGEEDAERMEKVFDRALEGSIGNEVEFRLVRKDGSVAWAEVSWRPIYDRKGAFTGYRASIRDVSAHKGAKEALEISEKRCRTIVENIDLGVVLIDADDNVVMTNPAMGRMFGGDLSRFVGKKCHDCLENKDGLFPNYSNETPIKTDSGEHVETEGVRDDGSQLSVRIQKFPVLTEDGKVIGSIEVVEDIAASKQRNHSEERR